VHRQLQQAGHRFQRYGRVNRRPVLDTSTIQHKTILISTVKAKGRRRELPRARSPCDVTCHRWDMCAPARARRCSRSVLAELSTGRSPTTGGLARCASDLRGGLSCAAPEAAQVHFWRFVSWWLGWCAKQPVRVQRPRGGEDEALPPMRIHTVRLRGDVIAALPARSPLDDRSSSAVERTMESMRLTTPEAQRPGHRRAPDEAFTWPCPWSTNRR
jgi:hypothetical protein